VRITRAIAINILLHLLNVPSDNRPVTVSDTTRIARPVASLLLYGLLLLSACGTSAPSGGVYAGGYVGGRVVAECAPFARALTGVRLSGEAADWWWEADGRYAREHFPEQGSLLVLRRTGRLPDGHVAVVSRVLSLRWILVTQANWVHHRVTEDQPVMDVSPDNDWSMVRVWWPPVGAMGVTDYPAYGFILPDRPESHAALRAAVPRAIRVFGGG